MIMDFLLKVPTQSFVQVPADGLNLVLALKVCSQAPSTILTQLNVSIAVFCPQPSNLSQVENAASFAFDLSSKTNYSVGSTLSFQCKPGFQLEGSNQIECQENEIWSQIVGQCRIPPYFNPSMFYFIEPNNRQFVYFLLFYPPPLPTYNFTFILFLTF